MRSVQLLRLSLPLMAVLSLSGCLGGDSGGGGDDTRTGSLTYNGISGLNYTSASRSETTDDRGQFRYYPGERLTFAVGDLTLATEVPAAEYMTPLEFLADIRERLNSPGIDDEGLRSHQVTEQQLRTDTTLLNLTRFLLALNWDETIEDGEGIEIRDRVVRQLNRALPDLTAPIDFTVSESEFTERGTTPSPANQLLAAICFYPADDEHCQAPPTQDEIDNAMPRPEDENLRDPDQEYQEDLKSRRDRILESVRSLEDVDAEAAQDYLTRELDAITTVIGNRYYLGRETANHPANETDIKEAGIRRINGEPDLAAIEAMSTRDQDVVVHSFSWQSATVDYFIAGDSGGESEIIINFRPANSYRWIRKSLRVIID
ncbi:organic solvent ABC transporter permease [Marinobacter sp. GN3S48]|uniref:organic solvent ABC transporter permease n=1 Tax=Marinobacter sp. GN3S48 TaxID=3382302 RepID=UPI00387AFF18